MMKIKLELLGILVAAASLPLACGDDEEDAQGAGGSAAHSNAGEGGEQAGSGGGSAGLAGSSGGGGSGASIAGESGAAMNGGQGGSEAGTAGQAGAAGEGGVVSQGGAAGQSGAAGQGGADDGPMPNPLCDTASVSSLQGSGTELDPYLFCLPEQLALFGTGVYGLDSAYTLGRDLDAAALTRSSLGDGTAVLAGSLDGGSHRITNMNASLLSQIGFGGEVSNLQLSGQLPGGTARGLLATTNDGVVRNVHVDGSFSLSDHAGALLGTNTGIVERCSAAGTIESGLNHVGGLVGQNSGSISQSWSDVDVTAGNRVGGLAGNLMALGLIRESYALGSVSGTQSVGGLVGTLFGGEVKDSFARAPSITGPKAGGLIGAVGGNATLTRCYAASTLPADGRGLVGSATHAFILATNSSYFLDTATDTVGTALSAQAMQSEASFVGWDFVGVWSLEPAGASFPGLAFAD